MKATEVIAMMIEGVWFDATIISAGMGWAANCKITSDEQIVARNHLKINLARQPHEVRLRFKDGTAEDYRILIQPLDSDDPLRFFFSFS